jgi:hypothetical protein
MDIGSFFFKRAGLQSHADCSRALVCFCRREIKATEQASETPFGEGRSGLNGPGWSLA